MLAEPRQVPASPRPDTAERRPHIHGIDAMPAGYDAEVAELFRDLRAATTLSESDLAVRLGTRPEVVQSLEQGALYALPAWPETCRVVNAYGALLNLDVRPLLRRIYAQLEAGIVELQPKQIPEVPTMTPHDTRDFGFGGGNSLGGGNHAGGATAPNPLDIPWPPPNPQAAPSQPARQNAQVAPAPHAPWPGQQMPQQPVRSQAQPQPQSQPHARPAPPPQPVPQAGRQAPQPQFPGAPQPRPDARPAPGQPQPQAHPQQGFAPQMPPQAQPHTAQPHPEARPQPRPQPQPQFDPQALAAEFTAEPAAPAESKLKRKAGLLKWGLGALIVSAVAFGLWFALSQGPGPSGGEDAGQSQNGPLDPDDPRSRKADRLPSAF
jgi:hypothetical protein